MSVVFSWVVLNSWLLQGSLRLETHYMIELLQVKCEYYGALRRSQSPFLKASKGYNCPVLSSESSLNLRKTPAGSGNPCREDWWGRNTDRLSHSHLNDGKVFSFRSRNIFFLLICISFYVNARFTQVKFDCYYTCLIVTNYISFRARSI